ncbi:serine/threonine-protein kinase RIO1 [Lepeophtheirus salmonis]|uniref:serine/threonine-protein kinase RIO1 n=1 Tax=Lepeophtheirus salmonis TaxID=72036 RepID=UPI001AE67C2B|nr:serine/threonine-protein kinase RIO1-like [Lepeophtheirus salmonis]
MSIMDGQFSDAEDDFKEDESIRIELSSLKMNNGKEAYPAPIASSSSTPTYSSHDEDDFDFDEEENEDHWDEKGRLIVSRAPNSQSMSNKVSKFQPADKILYKYVDKINVEKYAGPKLIGSAVSNLLEHTKQADKERVRLKDKADRATMEQVLDPRTRMIIFKFLNRGLITEINGCISTGKEANVYHCTDKTVVDKAVKIYKTSILVFKDRDKYVTGEFRFRKGYGKKNPRKMVRTWAEKEMRNLTRLYNAGIPCPEPILLRSHVLLMSFIGSEGWPAPRLHDVDISESKARELYWDLSLIVRKIYQLCKLVHGDLSEYNLLYHEGKVYVIDVSQSVEHEHPHALEFLRKDITNINDFFRRQKVNVLSVKELFDFVVDPLISGKEEFVLEELDAKASSRTEEEQTAQDLMDEEVFKRIFIPRRLNEVDKPEREISRAKNGQGDEPSYQSVTGIRVRRGSDECVSSSGDTDSDDENSSPEDEDKIPFRSSRRPRIESPDSKKERKKAVKDSHAEKRKCKVKKHIKKRKEKVGSKKK